ncbi:Rogdi leucine zipper containing protein-domain-containing protein [Kalaharituber pfeilii]|nr:Rogdi leucine zipper containing protein-domain-containing protein [Kalaharituber pfeilii]
MSTTIYPPLPAPDLLAAEEASAARELYWLLTSLQDTLSSLRSGLRECIALIQPTEPASTLVLSSSRSESLKGYVTRVGDRIVKGDMHIKMYGLPYTKGQSSYRLTVAPASPVSSSPVIVYKQPSPTPGPTSPPPAHPHPHLRSTSPLHLPLSSLPLTAAPFGHSHSHSHFNNNPARLTLAQVTTALHHLHASLHLLTHPPLTTPLPSLDPPATLHLANQTAAHLHHLLSEIRLAKSALTAPPPKSTFPHTAMPASLFEPPLPRTLAFDLTVCEGALVAELRTVEFLSTFTSAAGHSDAGSAHHNDFAASTSSSSVTSSEPAASTTATATSTSISTRITSLFGTLPLPSLPFSSSPSRPSGFYEEVDKVFTWAGRGEVRVRDKVRVESQDPRLMAVMVKVGGLEHAIGVAMGGLEVVRGTLGPGAREGEGALGGGGMGASGLGGQVRMEAAREGVGIVGV